MGSAEWSGERGARKVISRHDMMTAGRGEGGGGGERDGDGGGDVNHLAALACVSEGCENGP